MAGQDRQVGALCLRVTRRGRLRLLLITSRDTRRWVIPKGWPMAWLDDSAAAAMEALQETGVSGRIDGTLLGTYRYTKHDLTPPRPLAVSVFLLWVESQGRSWPERRARRRRWFGIAEAARRVAEPDLAALIASLEERDPARPKSTRPRRKVARVRDPAMPF